METNHKLTDFIDVMTIEKIKDEIDALNLTYNISVAGNVTNHPLNLIMVMEHNFVTLCELYNKGKKHTARFNWPNQTSISIERLIALKKHLNAPEDAIIHLEFARGYDDERGYDDVAEFVWFRPYKDFKEFYDDRTDNIKQLVSMIQNEHQVAAKYQHKLNTKK